MNSLGDVLSLEVPCDRDAPGTVRQALLDLDSLGWVVGDVMLVASELVTNAVLHSGCLDEHRLKVRACLSAGHIRISVWDPGLSGRTARVETAVRRDAGGWGLQIVDQLAAEWGAERGDGYRVWAKLPLSA
jgi:anti-sigma regulatory factor (Ser/Thr protein kinase)